MGGRVSIDISHLPRVRLLQRTGLSLRDGAVVRDRSRQLVQLEAQLGRDGWTVIFY